MIRQIAEMWNLYKPGRLTQPEGYVAFQLCFPVKIQITAKITIGPKQQLPNLQAPYPASWPLKRLLMMVMVQNPSACFDQKSLSQAGAAYGLSTLWTALITFTLMASIQEMCARIGLAAVILIYILIKVR